MKEVMARAKEKSAPSMRWMGLKASVAGKLFKSKAGNIKEIVTEVNRKPSDSKL